jgi:hypothetical protein
VIYGDVGVHFFLNDTVYACESNENRKIRKSRRHCAAVCTVIRHRGGRRLFMCVVDVTADRAKAIALFGKRNTRLSYVPLLTRVKTCRNPLAFEVAVGHCVRIYAAMCRNVVGS